MNIVHSGAVWALLYCGGKADWTCSNEPAGWHLKHRHPCPDRGSNGRGLSSENEPSRQGLPRTDAHRELTCALPVWWMPAGPPEECFGESSALHAYAVKYTALIRTAAVPFSLIPGRLGLMSLNEFKAWTQTCSLAVVSQHADRAR